MIFFRRVAVARTQSLAVAQIDKLRPRELTASVVAAQPLDMVVVLMEKQMRRATILKVLLKIQFSLNLSFKIQHDVPCFYDWKLKRSTETRKEKK